LAREMSPHEPVSSDRLRTLLAGLPVRHQALVNLVEHDDRLLGSRDEEPRAAVAMALHIALLGTLLDAAPGAARRVRAHVAEGRRLSLGQGSVGTIALDGMGDLPSGVDAIGRILEPLGYLGRYSYPLSVSGMTGWSFIHVDFPKLLPQVFVRELHVEAFSPAFQSAARRVTCNSTAPLNALATSRLAELRHCGRLPWPVAANLVPELVNCFSRRHPVPDASDCDILRAESAEMARFALEGHAFSMPAIGAPEDGRGLETPSRA